MFVSDTSDQGGVRMEPQKVREDKGGFVDSREPYEPPKADFAPISLQERLMGCGQFSTYVCGDNAAYQ